MQDFSYFNKKKVEYLEKANAYLEAEDRENYYINKRESLKFELLGYQQIGCKEAQIWNVNDRLTCRNCRHLYAKTINIEEALETMPIPIKNCPNRLGYCRCDYLPVWI